MRLSRLFVALVTLAVAEPAAAQRSGAMDRRLEERISVAWQGQTLGAALERLAAARDLPLWIDRRVDLSKEVNLEAADVPLREVFALLGAEQKLAVAPFHEVLYFGPQQTAQAMPALARGARAGLSRCPPATRKRWLESAPWSFGRLSEPRKLFEEMTASVGIKSDGDERIPHDLWSARTLPALAAIDRALLLLVGFDLAPEISPDGRAVRVQPINYDALPKLPAANSRPPRPAREVAGGEAPRRHSNRYTLRIDNAPVANVVDQLAERLDLSVTWDESKGAARDAVADRHTSCDVTQANLDELLAAVLQPAGLTFRREGQVVQIIAVEGNP